MSDKIKILGHMVHPVSARVMHMERYDPMGAHIFLRERRDAWLADAIGPDLVLMVDDKFVVDAGEMKLLTKAIGVSQFRIRGFVGSAAERWSLATGIPLIAGKPRVILDCQAMAERNAWLNESPDSLSKPETQGSEVGADAAVNSELVAPDSATAEVTTDHPADGGAIDGAAAGDESQPLVADALATLPVIDGDTGTDLQLAVGPGSDAVHNDDHPAYSPMVASCVFGGIDTSGGGGTEVAHEADVSADEHSAVALLLSDPVIDYKNLASGAIIDEGTKSLGPDDLGNGHFTQSIDPLSVDNDLPCVAPIDGGDRQPFSVVDQEIPGQSELPLDTDAGFFPADQVGAEMDAVQSEAYSTPHVNDFSEEFKNNETSVNYSSDISCCSPSVTSIQFSHNINSPTENVIDNTERLKAAGVATDPDFDTTSNILAGAQSAADGGPVDHAEIDALRDMVRNCLSSVATKREKVFGSSNVDVDSAAEAITSAVLGGVSFDGFPSVDEWALEGSAPVVDVSIGHRERVLGPEIEEPGRITVEGIKPKRHRGRLRSGQLLVHPGDVVVEGPISSGGEVVAGGDVHVYGVAGGRLLAGVNGDRNACIYTQSFDAELISIGGQYRIFEEVPTQWVGKSLKIYMIDGVIHFEELLSMPRAA